VREFNSSDTIGGGIVLEHLEDEQSIPIVYLKNLETGHLPERIDLFVQKHRAVSLEDILSVMGCSRSSAESALEISAQKKTIVRCSGIFAGAEYFHELQSTLRNALGSFHDARPAEKGIHKSVLKMNYFENLSDSVFLTLLESLCRDKIIAEENEWIRLQSHRPVLTPNEERLVLEVERKLAENLFSPASPESIAAEMDLNPSQMNRLLRMMIALNKIVKTEDKIYFHGSAVERGRQILIDFIGKNGHITIINFKQQLQTSRKFALSLLEFFDAQNLTIRHGDRRILSR
jgi:selenocysteine-specific elongation factor